MFVLTGDITIGNIRFKSVNDLDIKKSILECADTCVIKIPASSVLKVNGKRQTASVQTAQQFSVGQKVTVNLGYNGTTQPEFKGFVKRVNFTTPVAIECEGYSWQLRNKKNIKMSWQNTTLLDVLKVVVAGTDIKLHPKIPAMPLTNLVINNASGTQVIDYLIDLLKGTLTAFFMDDVLYMGLTYQDVVEQTVKYQAGWNVISDESLKLHNVDDTDVNIQIVVKQADGTEHTTNAGTNFGVVRKETLSAVKVSSWLTEIAKTKLAQEKFTGYDGSIEAFLIPYCQPGYRCEYKDPVYPDKNMNCIVKSVEIKFGSGGGRRIPELGIKLS